MFADSIDIPILDDSPIAWKAVTSFGQRLRLQLARRLRQPA